MDADICEAFMEDVKRDVDALLTAATERLADEVIQPDSRPSLNDRQKVILDILPKKNEGGLTGNEICRKLKEKGDDVSQSVLTSHVLPKLLKHYGVTNERGIGYFREA